MPLISDWLKSDNVFVRVGTATLLLFGTLSFLVAVGIMPEKMGRMVAIISLGLVVVWNYGHTVRSG